ncbi:MAG: hypothetical protein OER86_11735, partial [Phycisphaerae bacterium]|nr:hypothetical protein [Phycisphaerae bacterium]
MPCPARISPLAVILGVIAGFLLNLLLTFAHGFILGMFWWKDTPAHLAEARFAEDVTQCVINLCLILGAA